MILSIQSTHASEELTPSSPVNIFDKEMKTMQICFAVLSQNRFSMLVTKVQQVLYHI